MVPSIFLLGACQSFHVTKNHLPGSTISGRLIENGLINCWILKGNLHKKYTKANSEPSQTCKMEFFAKINNGF